MSISSMTNVAMSRRADVETEEAVPITTSGIVGATSGTPESRSGVAGAVQVIMTYVPTEILALYTSISAAIQAAPGASPAEQQSGVSSAWVAFFFCLIVTPVSVWFMYASKVKQSKKPLPLRPSKWPIWEMSASTLAFFAWAFTMPASPFQSLHGFYSPGIAAIVLPGSAMLIGLAAPIMQRELKS